MPSAAATAARSASVVSGTIRSTIVEGKATSSAIHLPSSGDRKLANRCRILPTVTPLAGRLSQESTVKGARPKSLRRDSAATMNPAADRGASGFFRS